MPGKRFFRVCIMVSVIAVTGCEKYEYCPPGLSWCWAECVDLNSDEGNCGSCGNECLPGGSCFAGVCEYEGCTTREDCAGEECLVCKDRECVPPPPVCYSDQDCCVGYSCNMGHCEAEGPDCASDDDCIDPENPRCVDGHCVPECITDMDCPLPEMICVDNHCELPPTCTVESCQTGEWCDASTGECLPGCDEDSDCVPPEVCDLTTHMCVEAEPSQLGDPCPYENVNATANYCAEGLECLGVPADGFAGTCPGGDPRECFNIFDVFNRDCVDGNCGASFCSQECGYCRKCPPGYDPSDVGSPARCMCVPEYGGERIGGPCPFLGVNAEYDYCMPGNACLGNENAGECPSGRVEDCSHIPCNYHPACVDYVCGFSFCAYECDAGDDCFTGFYPADVSGNCYCIPDNPGDALAGDPCPLNGFNASADLCDVFLTCLGNDDAGLCPGGDAEECTGVSAAFNPDCVDGICGYSFCSARCDDQGSCPAGFNAQDENAICYCVPE